MGLAELASGLANLRKRTETNPLAWIRWLRPQKEWLTLNCPVKLFRSGNQLIGKSTAGIAETIWRCRGSHPFHPVPAAPIRAIICCTTSKQSLELQSKLHALLPRDEIDWTATIFSEKNGFGANTPKILWKNGSVITFVTDEQGPRVVQGATADWVWIDELCSPEMFRELSMRVVARGGCMGLTLTPINRPADWLKSMVEAGTVKEVHAPISIETCTYADTGDPRKLPGGAVVDQDFLDGLWKKTPAAWADVIILGAWETRPVGAWFSAIWDAKKHVSDRVILDSQQGEVYYHLGFDYASADRPNGLCAVLVAVQPYRTDNGRQQELILVVDQVSLPGTSTMTMFAQDTIRMLQRNGLQWRQIRSVYGDNPVQARHEYKSNLDMKKRICQELQIPQSGLRPGIRNAKDGQKASGSRDTGCRYLYEALASARLVVHPRCTSLIQAIETWDYSASHPSKDQIDALRYSLKDYIFPMGASSNVTVRF